MKKIIADVIFHTIAALAPVLALFALIEVVLGQIH